MATVISPAERLFLDTSFIVALAARADQHHATALDLAGKVRSARAQLVTTRAVLLEIGNSLSRARYRTAALQYLASAEADPSQTILSLTDELWRMGLTLFQSRADKEWGLTDCISFAAMAREGITQALTADVHFEQAGFVALMKS